MTLAIFAVLWTRRQRWKHPGLLFFLYLILAGIERLVVEAFRAKDDRFLGALSVAKAISLGLIAAGLVGLARLRHRGGRTPTPLAPSSSVRVTNGGPVEEPHSQSRPSS